MTDLETRVAEALASIPHADTCWCSKGPEAYKMGPCICYAEREAKLALHVAAAIEAASERWAMPPTKAMRLESGLAALRGTPDP